MHYVIIGNGVAGITAAFALRKREPAARITVIGGESDYFFSRTALMYSFMDRMNLRDLEPFERKTYDLERIERVRGWVEDLDASQHSLRLAGGREIGYDRLLLAAGSVPKSLPWTADGVVNFVSLQDLAACESWVSTTRRAVVAGGGLIGVELAECLIHHGVKVDFLVREEWYWPMALAKEEGELIAAHLRRHGVNLYLDHEVTGISTTAGGRISAVRTNRNAELECQMLGVCIGVRPAIDWLRVVRTPPGMDRGVQVDGAFHTSLPDVWAAGDCAELGDGQVEQIWYSAKRQGELAARSMLGDAVDYRPPLFYNSARFFDLEYTTVGTAGTESYFYRAPGRDVSVRIMHDGGAVTGFNMLGSRWNHTWFEKWIQERRSLREVLDRLHLAQFDGELERIPIHD